MRKYLLLIILLFSLIVPISAQTGVGEDIELVSFASPALNVQGLRPAAWSPQEGRDGVFLRLSDPFDITAIIMQAQVIERDAFLESVRASFAVEDDLEVLETIETNYLTWDTYQFSRTQGTQDLIIDMAVAVSEEDGRVYYILMQTIEFFYEDLHEKVFLPAIDWMSPIQFFEDPDGQFVVPIPVRWATSSTDEYGIMTNVEGSIGIYLDAVESDDPLAAVQEFWLKVNPNFDTTFDEDVNNLRLIEDSLRIGEIEAVYIIDWADGSSEDGAVLQSVARVYDGVIYITLIATDAETVAEFEADIAAIDNGFRITALLESAEATQEAGE